MNCKLHICLVDDHMLFREGLSFLLQNSTITGTLSEAGTGEEFLASLKTPLPDVVLMDIDMPGMGGIEAARETLRKYPDMRIIGLSMYADENFYSEMIEAGAVGFLLKNSSFAEVQRAILEVSEGRNYFSPEILASILRSLSQKSGGDQEEQLTKREVEIIYLICRGLSNQQIADELHISKRTVDKHRENILLKTQSGNTAELVVYAIRKGYFEV